MLTFYEMCCFLEKRKNKKIDESITPEMRAKLLALQQQKQGTNAPPLQSASPHKIEAPIPSATAKPSDVPPNDPSSPIFKKQFNAMKQQDVAPTSAKAQPNVADGSNEKLTEKIAMFNNMLISDQWGPSQQGLTAMAVKDLKLPYKIPDGKFEIGVTSRGAQAREQEVIMPIQDIMKVMSMVSRYTKGEGGEKIGRHSSFKQALVRKWGVKPGVRYLILRALDFEKHLMASDITDQPTTIQGLADSLAAKVGPAEGNVKDTDVVGYIIDTAMKNGFGHFFHVEGDLKDPNTGVAVKSLGKAGTVDNRNDGGMIGSSSDRVKSLFGRKAEQAEQDEWLKVSEALDYWQF